MSLALRVRSILSAGMIGSHLARECACANLALAVPRVAYDILAPVETELAALRHWMKRFDLAVGSALALLGAFVTREALATRALSGAERTASYGIARVDTAAASDSVVVVVRRPITVTASSPAPEIKRRLEQLSEDTYIADVIASHDSALARWPDRAGIPLRVWVQASSRHPGFDEALVPVVRRAFVEWAEVGIPVTFTFVLDSSLADVHVTWVDRFNESISGKTLWAHDDDWWIIDANIQLAVHHHSGERLDSTSIRAIAMHEVGHLLGLDHTTDTTSIMAPKVRVRELSAADRATAQLLYRLPAGRLGEPTSPRR